MSSYLTIAVVCLLISEARLKTTLQLTRGLKDKFANPECVNGEGCSASQCAQYFARCETQSCTVCVCDELRPTYVASQGRCVEDDDIFPETVPEYTSFVIASPNGQPYIVASETSNKLGHEIEYTGSLNQLWLYTPSKKLLNLKTLKCLDFQDRVALRQCTVENDPTQAWYCNRSTHQLYGIHNKTTSNLDFTGIHFYMGHELREWEAKMGRGIPSRSICDIPDTYKGCYRYSDGSSVKRFTHGTQLIDCTDSNDGKCYEKYRISAPIFKENGYKATCSIIWDKSMISVNDQPWTKINMRQSGFDYAGKDTTPGEIEFRFLEHTKTLWAGALIRLEVECQNPNLTKTKIGRENHCVLLKFDGVFDESLHKHLPTTNPTKTRPKDGSDSRYKPVAIAIAVVLAVVILLAIVGGIVIYRRRGPPSWVTTDGDEDITAKPFYNSDEHL